ncbi:MAG: hypothetical protein RIC55_22160 [Pirellulaceae bacterium]
MKRTCRESPRCRRPTRPAPPDFFARPRVRCVRRRPRTAVARILRRDFSAWVAAFSLCAMGVASWALLLLFVTTPMRHVAGMGLTDWMRGLLP